MGFVRPVKYIPSDLSWPHLIRSAESFLSSQKSQLETVKVFGGQDRLDSNDGILKLSSTKISMYSVIRKIPTYSFLVYAGNLICGNKAYENQFSMLSFMAYPWLLGRFRDFSDRLIAQATMLDLDLFFKAYSNPFVLQENMGKFRSVGHCSSFAKERIKNWIKVTRSYLEDPLKNDASLAFPRGYGTSTLAMDKFENTPFQFQQYKLSDTRYFNLDELEGLKEFLTPILQKTQGAERPSLHLISSSSIVDFLFYNQFKDLILKEDFERDYMAKWILGFEPFIYFIKSINSDNRKRIVINMSDLPLVEVLSFG